MLKHIFLDLDDTIFDFHKAEAIAVGRTFETFGIQPDADNIALYSAINLSQWHLLEKGLLTRDQVKIRRFETLFHALLVNASPEEAADSYENNLAIGHYFMNGAEEMLTALHNHYHLYLVTNGLFKVSMSRLNSSPIVPLFDQIFISETVGYNKPSKEFFDICTAQIPNFSPEESIIYGDSLTSDIQGGKNAGIPTVWFNPHQKKGSSIIPDYEVHSHEEFVSLCQKLSSL